MNKKEKNVFIDVLNNMLEENKIFYLADISGLTADQSNALRRLCYKQNITIKVVKNTLLKKAFDKNSIDFEQLEKSVKSKHTKRIGVLISFVVIAIYIYIS